MIEAIAKAAATEAVKEAASSSAVKEVGSAVKDISKGKDLAQERLSKLEMEAKETAPEDYEQRDIAQERLEKLEKEAEQTSSEGMQDSGKQSVEQQSEMNQSENDGQIDKSKDATDVEVKKQDVSEKGIGGSYGEVREHVEKTGAENKEVHHMPADSASPLERNDGPAIEMDKDDHRKTASCGSSREAREYRAKQREMIENGDFDGAFQMDVDDLQEKFGDKYDDQIEQAREYKDKLKQEGRI